MDLPILGTIDLTPSGLFLFFAAVIALGYFGYQLFGIGRAGRKAKESEETPQVDAGEGSAIDADGGDAGADVVAAGADAPADEIDKDKRPKDTRPKD